MNSIEVIPLGTVAPYPKDNKNCPGFLIKYKDYNIMLDCGNGCTRLMDLPKDLSNLNEKECLEYFRSHNYLLNKRVKVLVNDQPFIGEVIGIDDNFFLQIKTSDMLLHIDSGEIEIL